MSDVIMVLKKILFLNFFEVYFAFHEMSLLVKMWIQSIKPVKVTIMTILTIN